jgi:hypothetical protein
MANPDAEILIETSRIGALVEVRAVSAGDGLEVMFQAPASASQADIQALARAKLAYVRRRRDGGGGGGEPPRGTSGRGLLA